MTIILFKNPIMAQLILLHKILTFLHLGFAILVGPSMLLMLTMHDNSTTIQPLIHTITLVVDGGVGDAAPGRHIDRSKLSLNFMKT